MAEQGGGASAKSPGAWGQALTAVLLIGGLGGALWAFQHTSADTGGDARPAAVCPKEETAKPAGHLTGAQLCALLDGDDLAYTLGTPAESAKTASTGNSSFGGGKFPYPSAQLVFPTYTVRLAVSYDRTPVKELATVFGADAQPRTVLGRTAVLTSDGTVSYSFGGDDTVHPSLPARVLSVALDPADTGGSFEVALWRADGAVPDDAVLVRVAEQVLPTLPGWDSTVER
jgi:hypothetical protein